MIEEVIKDSSTGRLIQFLFNPPPLGLIPAQEGSAIIAGRLYSKPLSRLAVAIRGNAYFERGCPLQLCDAAAMRDIWNHMNQIENYEARD